MEAALSKHNTPFALARRYLIVLGVADGRSAAEIARAVRLQPIKAQKWVARYKEYGIGGLSLFAPKGGAVKRLKRRYGQWTVIGQDGAKAHVRFDCGRTRKWIRSQSLRDGISKSCLADPARCHGAELSCERVSGRNRQRGSFGQFGKNMALPVSRSFAAMRLSRENWSLTNERGKLYHLIAYYGISGEDAAELICRAGPSSSR
jgi:hypothetical protein